MAKEKNLKCVYVFWVIRKHTADEECQLLK